MQRRPTVPADEQLLEGVSDPMRGLLLQLLLYKSIFMGATFRELAERQESAEVRDALMMLHVESIAEAAGLTLALREWDAHPAADEGVAAAAQEAQERFFDDVISLKDSVVDLGLAAAMRAPTEELRRQLTALADVDRKHADVLRRLRGAATVREHMGRDAREGAALGAASERTRGEPLSRTIQRALDEIRRIGGEPIGVALGPDGMRHLRDEGAVDADTGRAFGLPVEIDMCWRGDCFAIESSERIGSAELLTAARARPEDLPS